METTMNIFKKLFKPAPPTEWVELKATKHCTRCKKTLETSQFNKCSRASDGLQYWCKSCQKNFDRSHAKKRRKFTLKTPKSNFEKPKISLNIPDVPQAQYRQLVELAKARKWPMEKLYAQMVTDFLTLHTK